MKYQGVGAIVTGGASGLGGAVAGYLSARGAKVTIFDLNEDLGQAKAATVNGAFERVDVVDEQSVQNAVLRAEERHGVARILVNCAGIAPPARVVSRDGSAQPLSAFSRIVTVNLIGAFNVLSKFAARLAKAEFGDEERGVIVNTASVAAFDGQIGQSAYAASKGGVVSMALPVARELARFGIRVNTVAPGIFLTPMLESLPEDVQNSLAQQIPFPGRLGTPQEFAHLVGSIISNPMLNGEVIRLDGAIRMAPK